MFYKCVRRVCLIHFKGRQSDPAEGAAERILKKVRCDLFIALQKEKKLKTFNYEVTNALGIHARPAALLAQCCVGLNSQVTIKC